MSCISDWNMLICCGGWSWRKRRSHLIVLLCCSGVYVSPGVLGKTAFLLFQPPPCPSLLAVSNGRDREQICKIQLIWKVPNPLIILPDSAL